MERMVYVLSAMAYGDCLITLSLLESVQSDASTFRILGTAVTRSVSGLLRRPLEVTELLPHAARFYALKGSRLRDALADFVAIRRQLRRLTAPEDLIAFERADPRNRALVPAGRRFDWVPHRVALSWRGMPRVLPVGRSAYEDRRDLVRRVLGDAPEWQAVTPPVAPVRSVLLNPCAGYRDRKLSVAAMENIVALCRSRGWALTLVDPCGEYARWREDAHRYLRQTSLADIRGLILASDLYFGPDSFLIHLAYYLRKPFFGFFSPSWLYFLPPGARELGNYCSFEELENLDALTQALTRLLDASAPAARLVLERSA